MAREPLKKLSAQHHRAITLMMEGQNNQQIAKAMGKDHTTISGWRNDPIVVEEMQRRMGDHIVEFRRRLVTMGEKALDVLETAVDLGHPDAKKVRALSVRAANSVLDRLGVVGMPERDTHEEMTHEEAVEAILDIPVAVLQDALARKVAEQSAGGDA